MLRKSLVIALGAAMSLALAGPAPAQQVGTPFVTVNAAPEDAAVAAGDHFAGTEMTNTRAFAAGPTGPAPVFVADDEYGCLWATASSSEVEGWIGVARRGLTEAEGTDQCPGFQTKLTAARAAGAIGLIVVNHSAGHEAGTAAGDIPSLMIGKAEGDALISSLDAASPDAVTVTLEALDPNTLEPPLPVEPTRFTSVDVTTSASSVEVAGRALYGGNAPVTVGTDPEGDPAVPLPPETGNDLVAAYVGQTDVFTQDLQFIFHVSQLPASGGVPELVRYSWDFGVDTGQGAPTLFQIDGKFTNVTGSAYAQNPDTRTPAFNLEGNCTQDGNIISCEQIAQLSTTMDAATGKITVTVPRSDLEEQIGGPVDGAAIQQADIFEGIAVLPSAVFSASGTGDTLLADQVDYYTVAEKTVEVGIVPAGAPAEYTTSVAPASSGTFSTVLDTSTLASGSYDVHTRACFGTNCATDVQTIAI